MRGYDDIYIIIIMYILYMMVLSLKSSYLFLIIEKLILIVKHRKRSFIVKHITHKIYFSG